MTADPAPNASRLAAVAIGRNEGARLVGCLAALRREMGAEARIVYVDSGSTDGSLVAARAVGAEVVELDTALPFTAARARNAGLELLRQGAVPDLVQFVDGDCELQPGWLPAALGTLAAHPGTAVVCGRRRERHPEASVWNRLCDAEWDTPVGVAKACGGDALIRREALDAVGGYDARLIAGEEPEMCVRLRAKGWEIRRIDAEMTLHDADMHRLGQWWKRTRRGGYAAAEGMAMHGHAPERHGVARVRRALLWGMALPVLALAGSLLTPWALLLLLAYPVQVARLALRRGGGHNAWEQALFLMLGKFAEVSGVLGYAAGRLSGRRGGLIEYK